MPTLLETHGTNAELLRWSRDLAPSHSVFCSLGVNGNAGGLLMCVANKWLQEHDAVASFEEIVAGRVGSLSLSPAREPRCYIMGIHNYELGDKLKVAFEKQLGRAPWIRERGESSGLGIIHGDFNFSAADAPRWRIEEGPSLRATGQSVSDRAVRQKWGPLLNRTLDITKHEATHTSIAREPTSGEHRFGEGSASVIDHVYIDVDPWQHEFTWTSTGPIHNPFQMKKMETQRSRTSRGLNTRKLSKQA